MILEHLYQPEPGAWKVVFRASRDELAHAIEAVQAADDAPAAEEDLLTAAVNNAILAPDGFSPIYAQIVAEQQLVPVTDPDFSLSALNREEGFRAEADFFAMPPLVLGRYTGFVQPIEPHPIRPLIIELEVNRHHNAEDRAADEAGKKALRSRVAAEIYEKRCAQARTLAEQKLVYQLGAEVTGQLPKQLVAGNYFAHQRRFNLSLQGAGVNFDQYLKVRGQTVEQFRAELHAEAEQTLRSRLGLLLVADKQALWPTAEQVNAALAAWNTKRDGEKTFPANDERKMRQKLASASAAAYVVAHSTLIPPPAEPVIAELEQV